MQIKQEINPVFTFDRMMDSLKSAMGTFPDLRVGKNTRYAIADAGSGAFSVFFTQCPSLFLAYQEPMQQKYGLSNARSLFGIGVIPSDNHIRDLLDPVSPAALDPVFQRCFDALSSAGNLADFRVELGEKKNDLLIALDGTEYQTSATVSCGKCSVRKRDGQLRYCHSMVTPTIVAPGINRVISLAPSFITPQDGDKKQDCELKASKRWLASKAKRYSQEKVTILGDDLYAHEPFCAELREKGFNFILVCKPDSHKTVYDFIKGITRTKTEDRFDGKKHLASLLATMNVLSFLFHTVLEFMDNKYRLLRKVIGARKRFFEHIRVLLIYVPCQNFDHFMDFMIEGLKQQHDVTKLKYPV